MSKKKLSNKKIKVLVYADAPTCATGFSTVSRNICEALYKTGRYEIDIFGINFWGDPYTLPYRIWPAGTNQERDPYGRTKFGNMAQHMEFDILFCLQDTFILEFMPDLISKLKAAGKTFKSICYFPIDGKPKENWVKTVDSADKLVAYSEYGKKQSEDVYPNVQDMRIITHGANVVDFKLLPEEEIINFKKMYFGKHADKFIVVNLNRNQHRKDIPRTIAAFKEFRKEVPESILYLHMAAKDQGWDLIEVCKTYGFNNTDDVIFPENFGPNQGYPTPVVNMIYNAADLVVSTTLGEGTGLSWLESMATKTPVLMPNNTAMTEFITEERGYLCDSGTTPSLHTVLPNDNEVIRPLVDIEDMAKKMVHIYNNYDEAIVKAENAYRWINKDMNWQGNIGKEWVKLFDETYKEMIEEKVSKGSTGSINKIIDSESL